MPLGDYLGADAKGRPMQCRTAPLAGQTLALSPLTTAQVIELHSVLFELQDIAMTLIYYPECFDQHDDGRVFQAFGLCAKVLFPDRWQKLIEGAALALQTPAGTARLRSEVRNVLTFYRLQHDWPRIFRGLLGIVAVKDNLVQYRKRGVGRLSFEGAHLQAMDSGAPHVFEMLHWRPEAYLSEFDAVRELQEGRSAKPGERYFSGTVEEFGKRLWGEN